jgi:hypothetical protein
MSPEQERDLQDALQRAYVWLNHGTRKQQRLEAIKAVTKACHTFGVDPYGNPGSTRIIDAPETAATGASK